MNPPVLLIPGTMCTPAVFESQIAALAPLSERIDCVEFSDEDSIPDMANKAIETISGHESAAIIGFSMGGMVAMEIARIAPALINRLALLNSNAHADHIDKRVQRSLHLELARSAGMEYVIRQQYLDLYLHDRSVDAQNLIIKMASELGTDCFTAQIKALTTRPDSRTTLESLDCPTLILGSNQDALCPPAEQQRMHSLIKNSELVMLDQCGHFSTLERPAEVNTALQNWYLGKPVKR